MLKKGVYINLSPKEKKNWSCQLKDNKYDIPILVNENSIPREHIQIERWLDPLDWPRLHSILRGH